LRTFLIFLCLSRFLIAQSQGTLDVKGEIVFPFVNYYSAYGLSKKSAKKSIKLYENLYEKAKKENSLNDEMRLFALVKERGLLYNPYVIVRGSLDEETIVYMDSATYQKIGVWNYKFEELTANQNYLWFMAKTTRLGENAYWLTEFNGISLLQDTERSTSISKFARDVYRK
jgi:hypothetical protein